MGSSRTKKALASNHATLENHQRAYNLGLNGINAIESHLAKFSQGREIWAKNHPDEVKLVKEIKQKYDSSLAEKN